MESTPRSRDIADEYAAVRSACGVVPADFRRLLRVTGEDRVTFLQGMLSNEVTTLAPDHWIPAAFLTVQGRVVTDLRVYSLDSEIWLEMPAARLEALVHGLDRYLVADDVELEEHPTVSPLLYFEGPRAAATLGEVLPELRGEADPAAGEVRRAGDLRIAVGNSACAAGGCLVLGEPAEAARLKARAVEHGAVPIGRETLEALRIEAGIPWCPEDMNEETLLPEVGLPDAVSFTKGCYLGQEVVERVASRGQVQKKLVGFALDGNEVPAPGTEVKKGGESVGFITSAAPSPVDGRILALGYAKRAAWSEGEKVEVAVPEGTRKATVSILPFARPEAAK